jgi:hypothetical protein
VHCGYPPDERISGKRRLFGPLIGGLERHDEDLCLIHGVRSDTTNHPDGLAMLARGSISARPQRFDEQLAQRLPGDAPLTNLDLASPDGDVPFYEAKRPQWAALRGEAQRAQIGELNGSEQDAEQLARASATALHIEHFLAAARRDAARLDRSFKGFLGRHLRLAFQAVRGNWAKCVSVASRALFFDSHSDNFRFQRERVPSTFADLATLIDLLKGTHNRHGALFEQTTIVVFSEFGRFPRLNREGGKDHWPENTWILAGKGVVPGLTIGASDDRHVGLPVDFRSGQVQRDGGRHVFLDNAFATIAGVASVEPVQLGYDQDAVIDCVLARA